MGSRKHALCNTVVPTSVGNVRCKPFRQSHNPETEIFMQKAHWEEMSKRGPNGWPNGMKGRREGSKPEF